MTRTVEIPLNKPLRVLLIYVFSISLFLSIGFGLGITFEKHLGTTSDKAYSSGVSSATVNNYNQVFREGVRTGKSKEELEKPVYRVSIEGRKYFETRLKQKISDSYQQGFEQGRRSVSQGPYYNKSVTIGFTGEIRRGGVTYRFVDKVEGESWDSYSDEEEESLTGFSYPERSLVLLESGRRAWSVDRTCNHEMLHLMFPDFQHPEGEKRFSDPVYTLTDEVNLRVCNSVVQQAVNKTIQ